MSYYDKFIRPNLEQEFKLSQNSKNSKDFLSYVMIDKIDV